MENKYIVDVFKSLEGVRLANAAGLIRMAGMFDKSEHEGKDGQILEGISFRYKTVQFHLVDDTFEELEREGETFGDVKIYSERFSLTGYGEATGPMSGKEYQYEIIIGIQSKTNPDDYYAKLEEVLNKIEKKHDLSIYSAPYEEIEDQDYQVHRITYYTSEEGVFPKE